MTPILLLLALSVAPAKTAAVAPAKASAPASVPAKAAAVAPAKASAAPKSMKGPAPAAAPPIVTPVDVASPMPQAEVSVAPGASVAKSEMGVHESACRREGGTVSCFADEFDQLTRMTLDYKLRAESCEPRLKDCTVTLKNWKESGPESLKIPSGVKSPALPDDKLRRIVGVSLAILGAASVTAVMSVDAPPVTRAVVGISGALTCATGFTIAVF